MRFGRKPVSGLAGKVVDHWAIQVGEVWWEVAGPEDDGHIRGRPDTVRISDGLFVSSDIVADYIIKEYAGDHAGSGAVPSVVPSIFPGIIWALFAFEVVGIFFVGWIHSLNLLFLLFWILWVVLVPFLGQKIPEQYSGEVYFYAIFYVGCLITFVIVIVFTLLRAAEPIPWQAVALLLLIYSFLCIICICLFGLLGLNWWNGEYDDPR